MDLRHNPERGPKIVLTGEAPIQSSSTASLVAAKDIRPNLTALEWQVVAAAFSDASGHACGSGRKPSRLKSVFLCFTRDNGRPSRRIWDELLDLGFSEAQVEALALLALEGARPRTKSSGRVLSGRPAAASNESSQRLT
jgi:hypothetical protein